MLTGISTPGNVGIALYGDYRDLETLHETVHHLVKAPNLPQHLGDYVLGFAFEVRKSFEGQRESKVFGTGPDRVKYFGARHIWPFFLSQVAMLRSLARWQPCSALHHSQLYLLEHVTVEALSKKDAFTAHFCQEWLNNFPGLTNDYLTEFINEAAWKFVYQTRAPDRLGSLPEILRSLHWFSDECRSFGTQVRAEAKKLGVDPTELTTEREWPDFKW